MFFRQSLCFVLKWRKLRGAVVCGVERQNEWTELFPVGCCLTHVRPVCLKEWKLSLFSASCGPVRGLCSVLRVYENISFCQTEVLLSRGSISSGAYHQSFENKLRSVCFCFKDILVLNLLSLSTMFYPHIFRMQHLQFTMGYLKSFHDVAVHT